MMVSYLLFYYSMVLSRNIAWPKKRREIRDRQADTKDLTSSSSGRFIIHDRQGFINKIAAIAFLGLSSK